MPLIADTEHSTISQRKVQPLWIVLAVIAVFGLIVVTRLVPDPAIVERVTISNDTEFDLDIDAAASDHDGWTPVGIAFAGSDRTFEQVIDHGDEWVFRFRGQGRDGGEVPVTRAELEANDWVLEVPESVTLEAAPRSTLIGGDAAFVRLDS